MDLNTADVEELKDIPGLGEKRARDLVAYREENGEFEDWDDVRAVPGFSDELVARLQESGATIGAGIEE
jgi:competence protein ComEA